jgi:crotonobetainyl-CoA:carnitine CoA-transferase CaiB-like acyl-CoA transferase
MSGPLAGIRILDISTIIAGPWSSTLLADLGAEVLKVEMPGAGDGLRALAPHKDGVPLWWKVSNRNKRGITLDLRKPEGMALLERLLPGQDVLVENFRPGTLDRWGLPLSRIREIEPRCVVLRVTGFGQTGPYKDRPGFARVFEAMSGLLHITGDPDRPPLHAGFPIADAVGGLFGALGILAALRHRDAHPEAPAQEVDLSMVEAMWRVLDFLPIEYDQLGMVRERTGNNSQYAGPSNVYRTRDGRWVTMPASTQTVFLRLCEALELRDLPADPRFADNPARVRNRAELDARVQEAVGRHDFAALAPLLEAHGVAFAPVMSAADIFADPHYQAREAIIRVPDAELGTEVAMQAVVPRFSATPGAVHRAGPALGQDNEAVYREELGLSAEEMVRLREAGVI